MTSDTSAPPAKDIPPAVATLLALPRVHSISRGQPNDGDIAGAVELPATGPGFMANPKRPAEARFGSVQLVQTLIRAAAEVGAEHPDAPLVINDIGLEGGGPIAHHGSHQNGRDVDVLFFVQDPDRNPRRAVGVPIAPDGSGVDFRDLSQPDDDIPLRLDVPRTFRFVCALLTHGGDQLQRIFVVEHVRDMLLREAERVQVEEAVRERLAMIMCQPGTPHDDHLHVRFYCTPEDIGAGCRDSAPTYPFRAQQLAELGLRAKPARPVSRQARQAAAKRTVTPQQARARAGPMDDAVVRFLEQRKSWLKKTTPPRAYCR